MQLASFSLPDRESSSARIEGADQGRGGQGNSGGEGMLQICEDCLLTNLSHCWTWGLGFVPSSSGTS